MQQGSEEQNGEPVRYRFQTPAIKYFTALILEAFAKSDDSTACQTHYHAALTGQLQGVMWAVPSVPQSARLK